MLNQGYNFLLRFSLKILLDLFPSWQVIEHFTLIAYSVELHGFGPDNLLLMKILLPLFEGKVPITEEYGGGAGKCHFYL